MIKFFRKIRQKLLSENKFSKYLIYAIGEIVLVVIGILIALSINNWNIENKNRVLERELLLGIKTDLAYDTNQMKNRFYRGFNDLKKNIVEFDSILKLKNSELDIEYLDSIFKRCIRQRNTFFPSSGTYSSIVNNGTSSIFTNKELYKDIQNIYDISFKIIVAAGIRIDNLSDNNRSKFNYINVLKKPEKIEFYHGPNTRNEIEFWFKEINHFRGLIDYNYRFANEIIAKIDNELTK